MRTASLESPTQRPFIELTNFANQPAPPTYDEAVLERPAPVAQPRQRSSLNANVPTAPQPMAPSVTSRAATRTLSSLSHGLNKARLPVAALLGAGLTGGTTYALAKHVHDLITAAAVDPNPQTWINAARTQAYDACYNGCDDCNDVNFAYNACAMTERANVTGVICDGSSMWNWNAADRYPMACLEAVGVFHKQQALDDLKQKDRNQLAIIILTVLAGVVGAVVTYKVLGCVAARTGAAAQARRQRTQGVAP